MMIASNGSFLGGIIGDVSGMNSFVSSKLGLWSHYMELLSNITADQPQLAFIALTRSLQQEWLYLQRVTPNCSELFADIEYLLVNRFLPSLFGHVYTPHKRVLYSQFAWVASMLGTQSPHLIMPILPKEVLFTCLFGPSLSNNPSVLLTTVFMFNTPS